MKSFCLLLSVIWWATLFGCDSEILSCDFVLLAVPVNNVCGLPLHGKPFDKDTIVLSCYIKNGLTLSLNSDEIRK
jgi:hypothetical protein